MTNKNGQDSKRNLELPKYCISPNVSLITLIYNYENLKQTISIVCIRFYNDYLFDIFML